MSNPSSNKTNKLTLSIAMTSLIALTPGLALAATPSDAPVKAAPSEQHGGKCAAGKCGTEKRFEKQALDSDPQGRLVRARDGKCGVAGEGIDDDRSGSNNGSKMTEGVCGQ
ncbi:MULTISPECIES: hypothetical protein [Aeromonas]|uniref:hypothetical protein n=1 Tax=Aeromonas TaxID=642 RepID=UPI000903D82E|nr:MULTISPECIES: hypothetical protein [Aeromonas]MCR3968706.1 hypothetical protein [Aeromonas veronii]MCR3981102.1 hypothetical protein [Aeromonas veronii]QTL94083.1 hypothetical protein AjGTCBM29_01944 [Aeromonas jandaei]QXC37296.1 hypothetical protein I6L40_15465 [Aeromonas sp. FDAARGOS 1410]